ncbi:methylase of polypeptide subunit release factors [Nonomuraea muscovyensis]|uniref:Methylase of polypeptide subunit release factors n=1 Tax=Nonomuraea muscovyensis TaxID=1124761 RepID=A0A7X0F3E5_9ACTN|nr:class I SAM-dependent methyltransferase [Nonomuraea muscovyensis]MBB6352101.1 methylase of polypeptide subunit release factors [Nonomuraea muscovyensis]
MNGRASQAAGILLDRHREIVEPTTFRLLGREWDLLPGVYAPQLTQSAALYAEWLPYPVHGSFCEVGSGCGYLAVTAALRGCASVTALDVSAAAADNTRMNAVRHGVEDRVRVAHGDMFAPLSGDDRFDLIFWNSNFVEAPAGEREGAELERAFFDPGYGAHEAYLRDAPRHLQPGGRLLLGFTDLGSEEHLDELAVRHGWTAGTVRAARCGTADGHIEYRLVEFRRAG